MLSFTDCPIDATNWSINYSSRINVAYWRHKWAGWCFVIASANQIDDTHQNRQEDVTKIPIYIRILRNLFLTLPFK